MRQGAISPITSFQPGIDRAITGKPAASTPAAPAARPPEPHRANPNSHQNHSQFIELLGIWRHVVYANFLLTDDRGDRGRLYPDNA
jgi:hypothetical protein